MEIKKVEKNDVVCAVIQNDEVVITDPQSALDVLMTAKYETGTKNIVIDKALIAEDFFILSSGLAGEVLQKYVNYGAPNQRRERFIYTDTDLAGALCPERI